MPPAAEGGRNKEQWHEAESVLSVRTAADAYFMRAFEKRDPCNLPAITLNAFIRSAQWATTGLFSKGGPGIINSVFFRYIITRLPVLIPPTTRNTFPIQLTSGLRRIHNRVLT